MPDRVSINVSACLTTNPQSLLPPTEPSPLLPTKLRPRREQPDAIGCLCFPRKLLGKLHHLVFWDSGPEKNQSAGALCSYVTDRFDQPDLRKPFSRQDYLLLKALVGQETAGTAIPWQLGGVLPASWYLNAGDLGSSAVPVFALCAFGWLVALPPSLCQIPD